MARHHVHNFAIINTSIPLIAYTFLSPDSATAPASPRFPSAPFPDYGYVSVWAARHSPPSLAGSLAPGTTHLRLCGAVYRALGTWEARPDRGTGLLCYPGAGCRLGGRDRRTSRWVCTCPRLGLLPFERVEEVGLLKEGSLVAAVDHWGVVEVCAHSLAVAALSRHDLASRQALGHHPHLQAAGDRACHHILEADVDPVGPCPCHNLWVLGHRNRGRYGRLPVLRCHSTRPAPYRQCLRQEQETKRAASRALSFSSPVRDYHRIWADLLV